MPRQQPRHLASALLLIACVAMLVTPLAFLGGRMLFRAHAIQREQFEPAVPLQGPYTDQELRAAEGRLAGVMPADEFLKGVSRAQLESAAEATRAVERAKKESWEDRRPERLDFAARRRATGRTLLALAALLLAAWGLLAWKSKPVEEVQS
jgi:hypothetical protein